MTRDQIIEYAKQLPSTERYELAMDLWELAEDGVPVEISAELAAELDRRLAEDEADPAPAEDLDVVIAQLRSGEF